MGQPLSNLFVFLLLTVTPEKIERSFGISNRNLNIPNEDQDRVL